MSYFIRSFVCSAIEGTKKCGPDNYVIGYGDFRGTGFFQRVYIRNGEIDEKDPMIVNIPSADPELDMAVGSKDEYDISVTYPCGIGVSYWTKHS